MIKISCFKRFDQEILYTCSSSLSSSVLTEKRKKSWIVVSDHCQGHSILVGIGFKESEWKSESLCFVAVLNIDL